MSARSKLIPVSNSEMRSSSSAAGSNFESTTQDLLHFAQADSLIPDDFTLPEPSRMDNSEPVRGKALNPANHNQNAECGSRVRRLLADPRGRGLVPTGQSEDANQAPTCRCDSLIGAIVTPTGASRLGEHKRKASTRGRASRLSASDVGAATSLS